MTRLLLAALASALMAAATVAWMVHGQRPELTNGWDEPDDDIQPPDPHPVTLASVPPGRPVDAMYWPSGWG
jgi:hypothetical protein